MKKFTGVWAFVVHNVLILPIEDEDDVNFIFLSWHFFSSPFLKKSCVRHICSTSSGMSLWHNICRGVRLNFSLISSWKFDGWVFLPLLTLISIILPTIQPWPQNIIWSLCSQKNLRMVWFLHHFSSFYENLHKLFLVIDQYLIVLPPLDNVYASSGC